MEVEAIEGKGTAMPCPYRDLGMYNNEILEEIHYYREEYARSFYYDLRTIFNDLQKKQTAHKDRLVKLPIKRWSKQKFSRC